MKQIRERHLALCGFLAVMVLGAYFIYTATLTGAQTSTNSDGTTLSVTGDEPKDDTTASDPSSDGSSDDDQMISKTTDDNVTTSSTDDPSDSGTSDNDNDDDDNDKEQDDEDDDATNTIAPLSTYLSTQLVSGDPNKLVPIDAKIIEQQRNPYINPSNRMVNPERYMQQFVPRPDAEKIAAKHQEELTSNERAKLEKFKKEAKLDSDGDGIPDYEEHRLGTKIFSADSDGDGFEDGEELHSGFDPLKFSAGDKSDKISYQDPETMPGTSPAYRVQKAEVKSESQNQNRVELAGTALPNSILTIYIYSDPIVVTVQADDEGNWFYVLDKELEDGEHKVYAAVTDTTGKVSARSDGLTFVKTALALDVADEPIAEQAGLQVAPNSPVEEAKTDMTIVGIGIVVATVILALLSIGYFVKSRTKKASFANEAQKQTAGNDNGEESNVENFPTGQKQNSPGVPKPLLSPEQEQTSQDPAKAEEKK